MQQLKPVSAGSRQRAGAADPNEQRCLIENFPKVRGVEVAHVFERENSRNSTLMTSLEYSWGLRKDTLNLDTRRNIFFLGAVMHLLYRERKWALCPSEAIVDRYLSEPIGDSFGFPLGRDNFPQFSEITFEYTILPLGDMTKINITRDTGASDGFLHQEDEVKTHRFPFQDLPILKSHVHPNFVILHLSLLLYGGIMDPYLTSLVKTNRVVNKLSLLAVKWCSPELPRVAKYDASFITDPPPMPESDDETSEDDSDSYSEVLQVEDELDYQSSDGDSTYTAPRRIQILQPAPIPLCTCCKGKRGSDDLNEDNGDDVRDVKRRKLEQNGDRLGSPGSGWTKATISSWARDCSTSPASPSAIDSV